MSRLYHLTRRCRVPSIAERGLLPTDELKRQGLEEVEPGDSKDGIVYATRGEQTASGDEHCCDLCIDKQPARPDVSGYSHRGFRRDRGRSVPPNASTSTSRAATLTPAVVQSGNGWSARRPLDEPAQPAQHLLPRSPS